MSDADRRRLEQDLTQAGFIYVIKDNFMEIDIQAIQVLNLLTKNHFNYRIIGQSMVIEESSIGGRIIKVEKMAWTLGKGN